MQIAFLIATSLIILISVGYLWFRCYYVASGLVLLFYLFGLYSDMFPYVEAYYAKWIIYVLFIGMWGGFKLLHVGKEKHVIYKVPVLFALLFIFSSLISAWLSPNLLEGSIRASTFMLLVVLGYIIIPTDDRERRAREIFIAIFVYDAIVILMSVPGIFHPDFYSGGRFTGIVSMATGMTLFAYGCLIICYEAIITRREHQVWYILLGIASLLIIILCKSRSGYLAAMVGILVVTWVCLPRTRFWTISAMFSLVLVFFGIYLKATMDKIPTEEIRAEVLRGTTLREMSSARWSSMQRAIKIFKQNPFFGIGMGTIPSDIKLKKDPDMPFQISHQRLASQTGYHLLLAETGAIGLTFYLGWLFSSIYACTRAQKKYLKHENDSSLPFFTVLLALFLAYAVNGIFEGYPSGAANIVAARMWTISGIFVLLAGEKLQKAFLKSEQEFPGTIQSRHFATTEFGFRREKKWRSRGQS